MAHTRRWSQEESRGNVCRAGREDRDRHIKDYWKMSVSSLDNVLFIKIPFVGFIPKKGQSLVPTVM
jgi:hypothetical protein